MGKNVTISDDNNENDTMSVVQNQTNNKHVEWSYDNEEMLAEWCDIAQCYSWLYCCTHSYYARLHAWYTIPSIIFSTISGTASFAQSGLSPGCQKYAPMIIGTINIVIGILATVQQYLKVSELKESHRIASVAWDKFARNISIELSKAPYERTLAGPFLKFSRQELDRLMESNQIIPRHIIHKFNHIFKGKTIEERQNYDIITKPDICNNIRSIHEKRHLWFLTREDGTINKNRSNRTSINAIDDYTLPSFLSKEKVVSKNDMTSPNIIFFKTSDLPRPTNIFLEDETPSPEQITSETSSDDNV